MEPKEPFKLSSLERKTTTKIDSEIRNLLGFGAHTRSLGEALCRSLVEFFPFPTVYVSDQHVF